MIFTKPLLLLLTVTILVQRCSSVTPAQQRATSFALQVSERCKDGQPPTCILPFLHKDVRYINATAELNRDQYLAKIKTCKQCAALKISMFRFEVEQAQNASNGQVKLPVTLRKIGKLAFTAFLVGDSSVPGGEAVVLVDKKNV